MLDAYPLQRHNLQHTCSEVGPALKLSLGIRTVVVVDTSEYIGASEMSTRLQYDNK